MKHRCLVVALVVALAACSSTPTSPSTTPPVTPPPADPGPVVKNNPPVIGKFTVQGTRTNEPPNFADASEEIPVTVEVTDAESAISDLTFNWTSDNFGTFIGSGPKVAWKAPSSVQAPTTVTLNLEVVETYTSQGKAFTNKATGSITISVHDSVKEVGDMARQFLLDFSDSSIQDVPYIMRNFEPTCYGTADETAQVTSNRKNFTIMQWRVEAANTNLQFGASCPFRFPQYKGDACAQVRTWWKSQVLLDIPEAGLKKGDTTYASGVDQVASLYFKDQQRFRLCDSSFNGDNPAQTSLKALLLGLVP